MKGLCDLHRLIPTDRGDAGHWLDLVLRRHLIDVTAATRARVQRWIDEGRVTINGREVRRVSTRTQFGDSVAIDLPSMAIHGVPQPEDLPLEILYEDAHLLAINKPAGIVVHPTYRHTAQTVLNALLWRAREWPEGERPSIVGRLDKQTSGLVLVAKTAAMHASLQRALAHAASVKEYLAVVYGRVSEESQTIDLRLRRDPEDRRRVIASDVEGAVSRTLVTRVDDADLPHVGLSLIRCRLMTGRTHQIRVRLSARGWPIVGDIKYGEPRWREIVDPVHAGALKEFERQALHA